MHSLWDTAPAKDGAGVSVHKDGDLCYTSGMNIMPWSSVGYVGRGVGVGISAWLRLRGMQWARWSLIPLLAVAAPFILTACGQDQGETGVKVIITPAPPTPTSVARSLTTVLPLPASTPVTFPANAPTITNVTGSQLMAGVKAKVKDSADGLVLRESPSTKAKSLESLAAGTVLNVLADPQEAEGRTWVKVGHGGNQGFVAAEFIDRIP